MNDSILTSIPTNFGTMFFSVDDTNITIESSTLKEIIGDISDLIIKNEIHNNNLNNLSSIMSVLNKILEG